MYSFASYPFNILLGYSITSSFSDICSFTPTPKKKFVLQPDWPASALPAGGPQEDSADCFFPCLVVDNQAHDGGPSLHLSCVVPYSW